MTRARTLVVGFLLGLLTVGASPAMEPTMDQRLVDAEQIYRTAGPAQALPEFERLLKDFERSGEARNIALAHGYIGACQWRLGDGHPDRGVGTGPSVRRAGR